MRIAAKACFFVLAAIAGCHGGDVRQGAPAARAAKDDAIVELVESVPVETSLDHPDVRDAPDVWLEMIDRATTSLDFAEFYASEADPAHLATSKLAPVVAAIERAAARGVKVRFLADASFVSKYPETLDRLRAAKVDVRAIDVSKLSGGILHAKYFVVDGAESFLGSQNFDWRALAHIFEMGVRIRSRDLAGALGDVFETDWALAAPGAPPSTRVHAHDAHPIVASDRSRITFTASPKGWLPDEGTWDLPRLVSAIDAAKQLVDVQLLTYAANNRDGSPFTTLDDALRRAAARGVKIRLLVSHWGAKPGSHARTSIDALANVPNVEVRVITIPPWSGGDIPFARVSHAKYAVFDRGAVAWVGTSNWEGDYFTRTRNVGVFLEGGRAAPRLEGIFDGAWVSAYASALPASSTDPAPR